MFVYTLAFIFNEDLSKILLIEKNRPEWQKGFLNGIGGKCEPNEPPLQCINREVFEECGLNNIIFNKIGIIDGIEYVVYVYNARISHKIFNVAISKTDEKISSYDIKNLESKNLLPSVKYLIPIAMQSYIDPKFISFNTVYGYDK